ncbi:SCO7613 C-terminal domain-containing membrane protein [Schumannella luteola]
MSESWTTSVTKHLLDRTRCPRCDAVLQGASCNWCHADLSGPLAWDILQASKEAVTALESRQRLIDRLPVSATVPGAVPAATIPAVAPVPVPAAARASGAGTRASSQLSLQSVLAVAGAGLVAVAAIVFAFFNPDLTDFATRTAIIAGVTAVFLVAAWLLARGGLQFSAEAVGALGTVFVGLDVWALGDGGPDGRAAFALAALGTLVAAAGLIAIGALVRIRSWVWVGLAALPVVPVLFGLSLESVWAHIAGFVAATAVGIGVHPLATRLGRRFDSPLTADRVTASVLQVIAGTIALLLLLLPDDGQTPRSLGSAAVVAALAVIAALSARTIAAAAWSYASGVLIGAAGVLTSFSIVVDADWNLALVGAGALVGAALASLAPRAGGVRPALVRAGAWTVTLVTAVPGILAALIHLAGRTLSFFGELTWPYSREAALAGALLLVAVAVAGGILHLFSRPLASPVEHAYLPVGLWFGMLALSVLTTWQAFLLPVQVGLSLLVVAGVALALALVPRLRSSRAALRAPLLVGGHGLLVLTGLLSWTDDTLRVPLGAAGVVVLAVLAFAMPKLTRPIYTGVAYAYALIIVAAAFALADFDDLASFCLTTTVAAVSAIVATLVPRVSGRHWYAVLVVTAVPFLIGVVTVLIERSGWTALSTGVTFVLLLVIVISRRPGLTPFVRTGAAALLVPALAVVVVCLGAQVLAVSASPITLPIIAAIVAIVLPSTGLVGAGLERHGIPAQDAQWSRVAIEVSSLITGAIGVLLALVRAAAGIPTTFTVLLIIGVGAIATALFAKRRYGWPLAFAAFTGALWCVWALNGVTGLEPYLLPPTLGAALLGAVLVARGLPGVGLSAAGLYATGLSVALVPILATQIAIGSESPLPWRSWLLLGFSAGLVALGAALPRLTGWAPLSRLAALRTPSLIVAVVAAAGGVAQAGRLGLRADDSGVATDEQVILPVLAYTAAAALLAGLAAFLLSRRSDAPWAAGERVSRSRWLYVPTVVFVAMGSILGMRDGWPAILSVYAISLALLAVMIVVALRERRQQTVLPPVLFLFAAAWCVAVASWSARELRVEAYSLPLGFALLAVGVIAMWPQRAIDRGTLVSWPIGFSGSWRLLAPGILAIFVPSVLATGTDPLTQRAILVIALALVAILIGNLRRLAAPFILGIIVLPIENVVVFAVQIGRNIESLPWWITLATAGAVLLVLAVTSERRVGKDKSAAARIRDLT